MTTTLECVIVTTPVGGEPWDDGKIIKKLPPLKYYHDLLLSKTLITCDL